MSAFCDLHFHSTYSEGARSPSDVVKRALRYDIGALSLTDHNDITGTQEMRAACAAAGIACISGVELYVTIESKECHLLGYGYAESDAGLIKALEELRQIHLRNITASLRVMHKAGFEVDPEFYKHIHSRYPGFSHMVSHLMQSRANVQRFQKELAPTAPSLFSIIDRYFARDCIAFLPQSSLPIRDAVSLITKAGGVAVLAHPGQQLLMGTDDHIVLSAKKAGIRGIELISPYHTWHHVEYYQNFALRHGLFMTGGSDYHTDINFTGRESVAHQWQIQRTPYSFYTQLHGILEA